MSFKNLFIHFVVWFMFRKLSQTSLGLEKAGWIPGSLLRVPARSRWSLKASLSCAGLCGLGVSGAPFLRRGREILCVEPGET